MPDYIQVGALIIECDGSVRVVASLLDVAVNSCMCMGSIHLHSLEMCVHHIKLDRANNQALVLQHHLTACAVLGGRPMGFHVVAVCSYTRHFTTPLASTLHVTDTAQMQISYCVGSCYGITTQHLPCSQGFVRVMFLKSLHLDWKKNRPVSVIQRLLFRGVQG